MRRAGPGGSARRVSSERSHRLAHVGRVCPPFPSGTRVSRESAP